MVTALPADRHITYQLQRRTCGKASCRPCQNGQGHGPYWYAYWREGSRLRSGYVGKVHPNDEAKALVVAQLSENLLQSDTPPAKARGVLGSPRRRNGSDCSTPTGGHLSPSV